MKLWKFYSFGWRCWLLTYYSSEYFLLSNSQNEHIKKIISVFLIFTLFFSLSGCSTLKQGEYAQFGYRGEAVVKEGMRIVPLDWLGNLFAIIPKLVLWNWKIERHHILDDTKKAVHDYIQDNPDLGNVAVQLNRYAPQDAWKRLFKNKGIKWPYRYTFGIFTVLFMDTLLINRVFAGDYYNPFTHTVNLYSDIPAVALHELGHAKDFGSRRYRGSYAILRMLPFTDLYQEHAATEQAFSYARSKHDVKQEIENYQVLYPAYGTYVGGYFPIMGGTILGAIVGHIWGRSEAHELKQTLA